MYHRHREPPHRVVSAIIFVFLAGKVVFSPFIGMILSGKVHFLKPIARIL
jgi:hypothetical protein